LSRLLDAVNSPADLRPLSYDQLDQLSAEIRDFLVETVHCIGGGGHLASNLGVVELTIALHRMFETPIDKIVWDVSHQVYVHKMLTGRRARCARFASTAAFRDSPTDRRATTTPSARGTLHSHFRGRRHGRCP